MPTKRIGDVKHPPIKWKNITIQQWFGTGRTAALRGGDTKSNEPTLEVTVKYLNGEPVCYDAIIRMGQVICQVYGFDSPHDALDEANDRIQRLAASLSGSTNDG